MVGIFYRKKVNFLFLEAYSSYNYYQNNYEIKVPLESFIIYCIQKFCGAPIRVKFLAVNKDPENKAPDFAFYDEGLNFIHAEDVPWQASSCVYPVVMLEDYIVTGLCAVARIISTYPNTPFLRQAHEEGILGFRKSCLQAPNEVSIWTKFCEVDIIKTVKEILTMVEITEIPRNLLRFENHVKTPAKVHNVYKIARDFKRVNLNTEQSLKDEKDSKELENVLEQSVETSKQFENVFKQAENNSKQSGNILNQNKNVPEELVDVSELGENHSNQSKKNFTLGEKELLESTRSPKTRKWKSKTKKELQIDCSTKIEDLNVTHQYAEGPFLTLADLVLLPSYHIIIQSFGEATFESVLPFTFKWYKNLTSIPQLKYFTSLFKQNFNVLSIDNITIPAVKDVSLYKCDPKRHNPKKRLFTKEEDIENALSVVTEGMELNVCYNVLETSLKWDDIPENANPNAGHLPDERILRKSQQLENLASAVMSLAKDGDLIVDFCCGSGHLGILLAYLLPKCKIILLENKEQSLFRAMERVCSMKLNNVYSYQCNLDFFIGKFDIGIGLHACGIASDLILDKCLKVNAKFVLCPCCYGSLHATDRIMYPRSRKFCSIPIDQYLCIGHAADQTHANHPLAVRGARCMAVIDSDRGRLAEENGYKVTLTTLKPLSCTPKNNLLIGVP